MNIYERFKTSAAVIGTLDQPKRTVEQKSALIGLMNTNADQPWLKRVVMFPYPNARAVLALVDLEDSVALIVHAATPAVMDKLTSDIVPLSRATIRQLRSGVRSELQHELVAAAQDGAFQTIGPVLQQMSRRGAAEARLLQRTRRARQNAHNTTSAYP